MSRYVSETEKRALTQVRFRFPFAMALAPKGGAIGAAEQSFPSEGPSSSDMLEDLPEELLRSVSLPVALGGLGKDGTGSIPTMWAPRVV